MSIDGTDEQKQIEELNSRLYEVEKDMLSVIKDVERLGYALNLLLSELCDAGISIKTDTVQEIRRC